MSPPSPAKQTITSVGRPHPSAPPTHQVGSGLSICREHLSAISTSSQRNATCTKPIPAPNPSIRVLIPRGQARRPAAARPPPRALALPPPPRALPIDAIRLRCAVRVHYAARPLLGPVPLDLERTASWQPRPQRLWRHQHCRLRRAGDRRRGGGEGQRGEGGPRGARRPGRGAGGLGCGEVW